MITTKEVKFIIMTAKIPFGITPASMKVARLKLAITNSVTIPSHSGMNIEMFS